MAEDAAAFAGRSDGRLVVRELIVFHPGRLVRDTNRRIAAGGCGGGRRVGRGRVAGVTADRVARDRRGRRTRGAATCGAVDSAGVAGGQGLGDATRSPAAKLAATMIPGPELEPEGDLVKS